MPCQRNIVLPVLRSLHRSLALSKDGYFEFLFRDNKQAIASAPFFRDRYFAINHPLRLLRIKPALRTLF